jgi:hypothetical protein
MSKQYIPVAIRREVIEISRGRCAYCHLQEKYSGHLLTVEHIIPESLGGLIVLENLCMACWSCNQAKGDRTTGVDSESGETVRLFHPNRQEWREHFRWSSDGLYIIGETATGRATITALKLNQAYRVIARGYWVQSGWHPPQL